MSEFVSWIEKEVQGKKKIYFLPGKKVFHTKKGKELQKELHGDVMGHSAIRFYYDLSDTTERGRLYEKECMDFSDPSKFPAVIVRAIKRGDMRGMATPEKLLTKPAWAEYDKVLKPAWDKCDKVLNAAWDKYVKVLNAAWAEYDKVLNAAWDKYDRRKQDAFWNLFANPENRNPLWR